jgi:ribosomal protein S18 acetylase RimI-like enzyme
MLASAIRTFALRLQSDAHVAQSTQSVTVVTKRQRAVAVRRGDARDLEMLLAMYRQLSPRTIYMRFCTPKGSMPEETLRDETARLLTGDAQAGASLIGVVSDGAATEAVAIVQVARPVGEASVVELAIVVRDDYQREGLGTQMSRLLGQFDLLDSVTTVRMHTLAENYAVLGLVRRLGLPYRLERSQGEATVVISFG